jgi:hypothetical protein
VTVGRPTCWKIRQPNAVGRGSCAAAPCVAIRILVTPNSLRDAVERFYATGAINNRTCLLSKLDQAAARRAAGDCDKPAQHNDTFVHHVQVQRGSGIGTAEADILIVDAP